MKWTIYLLLSLLFAGCTFVGNSPEEVKHRQQPKIIVPADRPRDLHDHPL